jgi:hypothetical protein
MVENWLGINRQYEWIEMKRKKMVGGPTTLFQLFF